MTNAEIAAATPRNDREKRNDKEGDKRRDSGISYNASIIHNIAFGNIPKGKGTSP